MPYNVFVHNLPREHSKDKTDYFTKQTFLENIFYCLCHKVCVALLKQLKMQTKTFAQQLVGISFNPSSDDTVGQTKQTFADLADIVMNIQQPDGVDGYLFNTIKGDCIRNILHTEMTIVKLQTLKY